MDEAQFDTCKSLIDVYEFDCEDDCKKFSVEGKLLSDPYKLGNKWVRHYSKVGELASQSASKAAKYYNLNVDLAADYIVGDNWKVCH